MLTNTVRNTLIASALAISAAFSLNVYAHGNKVQATKDPMFVGLELAPAKTVRAFHNALKQGDHVGARATLADDVLILEGGIERSADEYASHHMLADMAFIAKMSSTPLEQQVYVLGDLAYSVARKRTQGEYKDKTLDYVGLETIVLKKVDEQWKIAHIHWSR